MSGRVLVGAVGADDSWAGGKVAPNMECVLAPNASPWTLDGTNTWIVGVPSNSCLVIDPGPLGEGHLEAIEGRIEERGGRVSGVVLTHGHADHSAGAVDFAIRHGVGVCAWDERFAFAVAHRGDEQTLSDGQVIDIDGLLLRVVASPGHSSDSVCLVVDEDGIVLTGDTVLGRGTSLVAYPDGQLSEYLSSLERLSRICADSGIHTLLPGHGPVLQEPGKVLEYYLAHRRERLVQVQQAVAAGAQTAREVVETVYTDTPREVWPAAEATVQAQLDYLRQTGGIGD